MNIINPDQYLEMVETVAGIGHWRVDLVAQSVFWSNEVYKIHGVEKTHFTPDLNNAIEFYHVDDRDRVALAIEHTVETQEPFEFELRIVTRDGGQKHVFAKGVAETNEAGEVVSIFGIFQDITERVQRERTHLLEQQIHKNFIEQSHHGFWDWYINEDYIYISPRYWQMVGYTDKVDTADTYKIMPFAFEQDYEDGKKHLVAHFKSKGEVPFSYEIRLKHKDGSTVYVLCKGTVIEWDKTGRAVRMVGTHTDITAQKRLQQKLHDAANFHQLMMNNNPNLIFVKDNDLRIVQANDQFLALYPEDIRNTIIGTTTLEQYSEEDRLEFTKKDRQALAAGYSRALEDIVFPNGERKVYDTQKIRFEDGRGNPFLLAICQDVTQREGLIDKLTDSNEQLERFAHICSHDLHEPLRMVKSFTQLLESHLAEQIVGDEKAEKYLNLVIDGAERGQQLVSDILAYSKVSKEYSPLDSVDVGKIITEIQNDLPNDAKVSFAPGAPTVNANKTQLYQLFQNLISNGAKYQPEDQIAEISVTWEEQDKFWEFCICDNGIGIDKEYHEKVFDIFTRLNRHQTYTGSGIGLSICKKIVERYGGTIRLESDLGKGSKFYFQLPR